jgi:hypothetical protein
MFISHVRVLPRSAEEVRRPSHGFGSEFSVSAWLAALMRAIGKRERDRYPSQRIGVAPAFAGRTPNATKAADSISRKFLKDFLDLPSSRVVEA